MRGIVEEAVFCELHRLHFIFDPAWCMQPTSENQNMRKHTQVMSNTARSRPDHDLMPTYALAASPPGSVPCSSGHAGDASTAMCALGCAELFARAITAVCGRCRCRLCSECTPPSAPPRLPAPARDQAAGSSGSPTSCKILYSQLLSYSNGFRAEIAQSVECERCRVLVDFGRASEVTVLTSYGASFELVGAAGQHARFVFTPSRATFGFNARGTPSRAPFTTCFMPSPPMIPPPMPSLPPPPPPSPRPPSPNHPVRRVPHPMSPPSRVPSAPLAAPAANVAKYAGMQYVMVLVSLMLLVWCACHGSVGQRGSKDDSLVDERTARKKKVKKGGKKNQTNVVAADEDERFLAGGGME